MALLVCACAAAYAQSSVAGRVVDSATGEPLRGVHLRLMVMPSAPIGDIGKVYGALSDEQGRFSINPIEPGGYVITAERPGLFFAPSVKDGKPSNILPVSPGRHIDDLRIEMAPRAVLSGHVLDDFGNAPEAASVYAEPLDNLALQMVMEASDIRGQSNVNSRGEWRISLPAGKYRVTAQARGGGDEIRTDGTKPSIYVDTPYPSVVEARPGQIGRAHV
jgi:hypothetical protein